MEVTAPGVVTFAGLLSRVDEEAFQILPPPGDMNSCLNLQIDQTYYQTIEFDTSAQPMTFTAYGIFGFDVLMVKQ